MRLSKQPPATGPSLPRDCKSAEAALGSLASTTQAELEGHRGTVDTARQCVHNSQVTQNRMTFGSATRTDALLRSLLKSTLQRRHSCFDRVEGKSWRRRVWQYHATTRVVCIRVFSKQQGFKTEAISSPSLRCQIAIFETLKAPLCRTR